MIEMMMWDDEEMMEDDSHEEETMMEEDEAIKEEVMEAKVWVYAKYDESLVGSTAKTVLFFHANWCPTCVRLEKDILAWVIPADITILKVNYDTSIDLKKKYGVVAQTTIVQVDADWNEIKKWLWGDLDTIINLTK